MEFFFSKEMKNAIWCFLWRLLFFSVTKGNEWSVIAVFIRGKEDRPNLLSWIAAPRNIESSAFSSQCLNSTCSVGNLGRNMRVLLGISFLSSSNPVDVSSVPHNIIDIVQFVCWFFSLSFRSFLAAYIILFILKFVGNGWRTLESWSWTNIFRLDRTMYFWPFPADLEGFYVYPIPSKCPIPWKIVEQHIYSLSPNVNVGAVFHSFDRLHCSWDLYWIHGPVGIVSISVQSIVCRFFVFMKENFPFCLEFFFFWERFFWDDIGV